MGKQIRRKVLENDYSSLNSPVFHLNANFLLPDFPNVKCPTMVRVCQYASKVDKWDPITFLELT